MIEVGHLRKEEIAKRFTIEEIAQLFGVSVEEIEVLNQLVGSYEAAAEEDIKKLEAHAKKLLVNAYT